MTVLEQYFTIFKLISLYAIGICLVPYIIYTIGLKLHKQDQRKMRQQSRLERKKLFNIKYNNVA